MHQHNNHSAQSSCGGGHFLCMDIEDDWFTALLWILRGARELYACRPSIRPDLVLLLSVLALNGRILLTWLCLTAPNETLRPWYMADRGWDFITNRGGSQLVVAANRKTATIRNSDPTGHELAERASCREREFSVVMNVSAATWKSWSIKRRPSERERR